MVAVVFVVGDGGGLAVVVAVVSGVPSLAALTRAARFEVHRPLQQAHQAPPAAAWWCLTTRSFEGSPDGDNPYTVHVSYKCHI